MNINDYLKLKKFNDALQNENKFTFDVNTDLLSFLVAGKNEKCVASNLDLDITYMEMKKILDNLITKNLINNKQTRTYQSVSPILNRLNSSNSLNDSISPSSSLTDTNKRKQIFENKENIKIVIFHYKIKKNLKTIFLSKTKGKKSTR